MDNRIKPDLVPHPTIVGKWVNTNCFRLRSNCSNCSLLICCVFGQLTALRMAGHDDFNPAQYLPNVERLVDTDAIVTVVAGSGQFCAPNIKNDPMSHPATLYKRVNTGSKCSNCSPPYYYLGTVHGKTCP